MSASLSKFVNPAARTRFTATFDSVLKEWSAPYEERYIETRFGKAHLLVSGPEDGPPLLLLHGMMATNLMWFTHIAPLARTYRCYALQTITDAGKGEQTAPVTSMADYVTWFREVYAGLGLKSARVMGLSYGGFLATTLARHAPELVERLVLLCPAGTLAPLPAQFLLRAMPGMMTRSAALLRWYWAWFLHDKAKVTEEDPATSLFVATGQCFQPSANFIRPLVMSDEELREIKAPLTLLVGEHEVIYKGGAQAVVERARRVWPKAAVHLVPDASHVMTVDNPAVVERLMLEALQG